MRFIRALLRRFHHDERGAFAVIFAAIAIVLVAMSGAAVDFTLVQNARTKAQIALDAAALALQPSIYGSSQTAIQSRAQALLLNRLADPVTSWGNCQTNGDRPPCAYVQPPGINTGSGELLLRATLRVPMNFVSLVGVNAMSPTITAEAARKRLKLEVAMVLDNSGSMAIAMGYAQPIAGLPTRMQTLQSSARCAANILFYGVATCTASTAKLTASPDVKMAVVPFTQIVNIGPANASASWIDRAGTSTAITRLHFDDNDSPTDAFLGPVDRIALFSKIQHGGTPLAWGGCVEARLNDGGAAQYDTDDTSPDGGETLFTPYFAPDEPGAANEPGFWWPINGEWFTNSYLADAPMSCNRTGPNGQPYAPSGLTGRALQERLCKYGAAGGANMAYLANKGFGYGPNGSCPANAVTPLSTSPSTIIAAIDAMVAQGGTNIQEGTAWGFRALSPTLPFTEGSAYDQSTSKVMIVMTDGENTLNPAPYNFNYAGSYSAYGYPADARLGPVTSDAAVLKARLDARLATTCRNARDAGITIYTIGVDVGGTSDPAGNKSLLTHCASEPANAYFPNSATELQSAFVSIATQLAALRLVR